MKKRKFIKQMGVLGASLYSTSTVFGRNYQFTNSTDHMSQDQPAYKEASYVIQTPKGLRCLICPNECTLKEGEVSDCHNRKVIQGKLYSTAYGNPCALHVDPVEKKPLVHYYPGMRTFSVGTAGCNFSCLNCQNWEISQVSPGDLRSHQASPEELLATAKQYQCPAIAYTYTEPTSFFEYMFDTAMLASKAGIKNIMISNGFINPKPLDDLIPYLDAANIDLKAFNSETYMQLTGGDLEPVLDTLLTLKSKEKWIEITNLIIPGWTDDLDMIKKMCRWLSRKGFADHPLHFSRFHPAHKLKHVKSTPLKTLLAARKIALDAGLRYVYIGNVPEIAGENTACHACKELLVQRSGYTIQSNTIKDGCCPSCANEIPGHWG